MKLDYSLIFGDMSPIWIAGFFTGVTSIILLSSLIITFIYCRVTKRYTKKIITASTILSAFLYLISMILVKHPSFGDFLFIVFIIFLSSEIIIWGRVKIYNYFNLKKTEPKNQINL